MDGLELGSSFHCLLSDRIEGMYHHAQLDTCALPEVTLDLESTAKTVQRVYTHPSPRLPHYCHVIQSGRCCSMLLTKGQIFLGTLSAFYQHPFSGPGLHLVFSSSCLSTPSRSLLLDVRQPVELLFQWGWIQPLITRSLSLE